MQKQRELFEAIDVDESEGLDAIELAEEMDQVDATLSQFYKNLLSM